MERIELINNKGFSWFSTENIFIKGCFFDEENNYYEKEKALLFFKNIDSDEQFVKRIKSVNGIFTVIIKNNDKLFIACDSTRIFPIFYSNYCNILYISDQVSYLKEKLKLTKIDGLASEEFLASGHTIGKKTFLKEINQIQSNEYLCFKNGVFYNQGFFFSYSTSKLNHSPYKSLKQQAVTAFENSFNRLVKSLNNRQVVIPLSGGFDSRLIAVMLKNHHYKNVVCYTYGKKNSPDIENSKKVAEALNFEWFFIEYTNELIDGYISTEIFKKYCDEIFNYSSMLFLQEYFAVKYLKDNNLIASDSIFIPGHVGDRLGGSLFKSVIPDKINHSKISQLIIEKKFYYSNLSKHLKKEILSNVENQLNSFDQNYSYNLETTVIENYYFKEPIPKILFNSAKVYSFFGYEHRFPYWDKELLIFFKNVPIEYKKMKILYNDVLKNHYFEDFNVNFEKEIQPSLYNIYIQKIKEKIKPFLPYIIINKFLIKNDWLNSECITKQMIDSMENNNLPINTKIQMYNELNIQWYLYFCKGLIKK